MKLQSQDNNTSRKELQIKLDEFNHHWKSGVTQIKTILQNNWPKKPRSKNAWYIVIGEKNEGKSSLLHASESLAQIRRQSTGSNREEDEQLGFWMMQDSIILDTPGEMIEQHCEEGAVLWWKFLQQIKRRRTRDSVNGIILCISTETLRNCSIEALQQKGDNIGKRLIELTHMLNIQCPVYVVVTKCNKLDEQERYFQSFPISATKQVMGKLYQIPHKEMRMNDIVTDAVHYIYDQLNILRLLNLRNKDYLEKRDHNLFFPERLKMLKRGLTAFLQQIFIFDETMGLKFGVHLRGVFFTSVDVQDSKFTELDNNLHNNTDNKKIKGFFLQELFTVVLPGDKGLFCSQPCQMFDFICRYNKIFMIWFGVLALVFIIGFINYTTSSEQITQLKKHLSLNSNSNSNSKEGFDDNLHYINKMRQTILSLEEKNDDQNIIGFRVSASADLVNILKIEYTRRFYVTIFLPAQKYFEQSIALIEGDYLPQQIKIHQSFLLNRMELVSNAISGRNFRQLILFEQPKYELLLKDNLNIDANKTIDMFTKNYIAYLVWTKDKKILESELAKDKLLLNKIRSTIYQ